MSVRIDRKKLMVEMVKRDISVSELSSRSRVSLSTVSGIRSGRACSPKTAKALADVLSVPVDTLLQKKEG